MGGVCLAGNSLERFIAIAKEQENYAQTVSYLKQKLALFVRPQEKVLLCFADAGQYSMGALMSRAVTELGASPVFWGSDQTWQALLRQAFFSRATTIVGEPLLILGLTKLTKATGTPLRIRNVVLAGRPSERWMVEGIHKGLDAKSWGCYDPIPGLVVCGFSCDRQYGIHIRTDALSVSTGADGRVKIHAVSNPRVCYETNHRARLVQEPCACGNPAPLLTDFQIIKEPDLALDGLQEMLLSWSSILDYRAVRTENGLELEIVAFPGERLPVLPSCAKRYVRPWMPKHDVPFCVK